MNKSQIKKLASLYGMKLQYLSDNEKPKNASIEECTLFLKALGVNVESDSEIEKNIRKIELKQWANLLGPSQVIKNDKYAVIKIKVPKKLINKDFNWKIKEENGDIHNGALRPSRLAISGYNHIKKAGIFYQFDFPLPVRLAEGYHSFSLEANEPQTQEGTLASEMRLIVVPNNAYIPESILNKHDKIFQGAKLSLTKIKSNQNIRILDSFDFKYILRKLDKEKNSIVSISAINQTRIKDSESYNINLPASKLFFNTLYLNIDSAINLMNDKSLAVKVLSSEYQELMAIDDNEQIDYKKIYNAKLEIFKIIYQSFRENHINKETELAQEFYKFANSKGAKFKKIALFRAIEEYFWMEDNEIDSWHKWPESFQKPHNEDVINFRDNNIELVQFYEFWQWQEDLQLAQIGKISYDKNLDVGLMTELPYGLDASGADSWLKQEMFCNSNQQFFLLPSAFSEDHFDYFVEILKTNMRHVGALKISDIRKYLNINLDLGDNKNCIIEFNIDDVLGVLALESQRNQCLLVCDRKDFEIPKIRQLTYEYNILNEDFFNFIAVESEKDLKKIFIKENKKKSQETKQPLSTYRLQLNNNFRFSDAQKIIPYMKNLGITHCYVSPILKARTGSTHCYDIVNHSELHPEIGTKKEFYDFADELHNNGMGLICDIVPNHMGINHENKWWYDILENGQSSEFADYFDIDWNSINKNIKQKVLLPILGEHYGEVLNKGLLSLAYDNGLIYLKYYHHKFPINPSSYPQILLHRLEVLSSRIGSSSDDFLEYASIITSFENLPEHTETSYEGKLKRNREKRISSNRLHNLTNRNQIVLDFILENLEDYKTKENDSVSCNRLNSLLDNQAYHMAYWRVSVDEINYRRFFDINDLAAISVNNPAVFENTHQFILDLIEHEKIDGLRIDHPDGLSNPTEYFQKLQAEVSKRIGVDFFSDEDSKFGVKKLPIYIWAEKILAPFEKAPDNWPIHGTVGYDFLNSLNGIFVKKENKKKLSRIYRRFIEHSIDFEEMAINCKKLIMLTCMAGELSVLANRITQIAQSDYSTRDFTYNNLRAALAEIIARFPVYRTYMFNEKFYSKNLDYIKWAVSLAKKDSSSTELSIYDFIETVLTMEFNKNELCHEDVVNFAMKFQQYTSPLMAKGLEDTAFYRYNRLISLNEVGAEPQEFGCTASDFHYANTNRLINTPYSMLATSTHDTKRSEDTRARINVISEIPEKWQKACNTFSMLNKSRKIITEDLAIPSKNDEYFFYQTLLGIWPEQEITEDELEQINSRLSEYMIKAMREAKVHTSWLNMNFKYEDGVLSFINKVIFSYGKHPFWKEFLELKNEIARHGNINSISQTLLKLTSPGVCDIYQGMEYIQLQLVDPDNRRPVDFDSRQAELSSINSLINPDYDNLADYSVIRGFDYDKKKLYITALGLNLRKNKSGLIIKGEYIPLEVYGENPDNIISFARIFENQSIITIAPKLIYGKLDENNTIQLGETYVKLSEELQKFRWKNLVNQKSIDTTEDGKIKVDFSDMPVMILESY